MVTGVSPAAGAGVPPSTTALGVLKGRARAGLELGLWAHLLANPQVDRLEAAAPARKQAGEVDEWGKAGVERVQAGKVRG